MVCEVCSVDRSDEDGELVILDYPRFLAADCPCPNCGSGVPKMMAQSVLSELSRRAVERRKTKSVARRAFRLNA